MPQSRGIFYGWVIVFAGLAMTLIMYGVIEVFGIMFKPLALDCRWDRGVVSAASMINWLTFGACSLACGMLSDRYGSKRVMLGGATVFIIGTLLMSRIDSLWQLYAFFGVMLAAGRAATGVPLTVLVTKWFTRHQGLALSLSQSQNVGSAVFAPLAVWLIADYGWRGAYFWMGIGAVVMIPLALLIRDVDRKGASGFSKPVAGGNIASAAAAAAEGPNLTLREAMRRREFWTINFAVMCCCITHSDILLHGANHMTDLGLDASVAARVVAIMAIFGMVGKIGNGILADRIGAKWALSGFLFLQAVMVPFFLIASEPPSFYAWAVLFGLGYGGPMPVYAMLFRQYFGTRSLGALLGMFFVLASTGMGLGGLMGGVLQEMSGSYTLPFLISCASGFVATFLVLTLPMPGKPRAAVRRDIPAGDAELKPVPA